MMKTAANGITLAYDAFGRKKDPALILIMGLSGQMIMWDEDLCRGFADRGFRVIRFDNRDTGLSSKCEDAIPGASEKLLAALLRGEDVRPPYTLKDMALDVFGLMDGLGVKQAHVLGASMGGMIAQTMAVLHPERVVSLVSLSSAAGPAGGGKAESRYNFEQIAPVSAPPADRSAYIAYMTDGMRELSGPGYSFDADQARILAARCFDRCYYPQGTIRQFMAILASGDRRPALRRLAIPALVIHGDCDPLVPVEAGEDTAAAIPGARLKIIRGMGHDLPREIWPDLIDTVCRHIMHSPKPRISGQ